MKELWGPLKGIWYHVAMAALFARDLVVLLCSARKRRVARALRTLRSAWRYLARYWQQTTAEQARANDHAMNILWDCELKVLRKGRL